MQNRQIIMGFLQSENLLGVSCLSLLVFHILLTLSTFQSESESHSVVPDSLRPRGLYSPWISPAHNTGVGSRSFLQGIFPTQESNPGPALQVDSLPADPQGKPKNTGVGSLSLLQRIFVTQGTNWGLLHCRWTLYQASYGGSPVDISNVMNR